MRVQRLAPGAGDLRPESMRPTPPADRRVYPWDKVTPRASGEITKEKRTSDAVEVALTLAAILVIGFAIAKISRLRLYGRLQSRIAQITASHQVRIGAPAAPLPDFGHRFAVVPNALDADTFGQLRAEAERLLTSERSYLPVYKQGGTVAYETLVETSPTIVSLYHSPSSQTLIARVCGDQITPTPINDQSSLSVLFYTKPGDHISRHSPSCCRWSMRGIPKAACRMPG